MKLAECSIWRCSSLYSLSYYIFGQRVHTESSRFLPILFFAFTW